MNLVELAFELGHRKIALHVEGARIRYAPVDRMTPALVDAIRQHKAELIPLLESISDEEAVKQPAPVAVDPASVSEDLSECGEPCPTCGSLLVWWDGRDVVHCMRCDPPTRSLQLWHRAERIRRRLRKPTPPEMVARMELLERLARSPVF